MPSLTYKILSKLSTDLQPVYPIDTFSEELYADLAPSDSIRSKKPGGLGHYFTTRGLLSIDLTFQFQHGAKPAAKIRPSFGGTNALVNLVKAFENPPKSSDIKKNIQKATRCLALICQHTVNNEYGDNYSPFEKSLQRLKELYNPYVGELRLAPEAPQILGFIQTITDKRLLAKTAAKQAPVDASARVAAQEHKEEPISAPALIVKSGKPEESKTEKLDSSNIDPSNVVVLHQDEDAASTPIVKSEQTEENNPANLDSNNKDQNAELISSGAFSDLPPLETVQASMDALATPVNQEQVSEEAEASSSAALNNDAKAEAFLKVADADLAAVHDNSNSSASILSTLQTANTSSSAETREEEKPAPKVNPGIKVLEKLKERERLKGSIPDFHIRLAAKTRYFDEEIVPGLNAEEAIWLSRYMQEVQVSKRANTYFKDELSPLADNWFASWLNCFGETSTPAWQAERHKTKEQIIQTATPAPKDHKPIYRALNQHTGYPLTKWGETSSARKYREKHNLELTTEGGVRLKK